VRELDRVVEEVSQDIAETVGVTKDEHDNAPEDLVVRRTGVYRHTSKKGTGA
jgi:hypothetical protein